ncbi:aspartate/glutamate racemase family protein [Candidatus Bathyarchaeota archaeon]|nr:aspartate/glutamate racemase family protein [Candidatus Bathyarchaeota archaeon]
MQVKILFIGGRKEWLQELAEPFTVVDGTWFDSGTPHLEYEFYEHLAIHRIIEKTVRAERDGYDAVVIGCFYDPGLREARELVRIPVVGVCEASLQVASSLTAGKFSILVGRRKWIPKMADNVRNYGFESRIASWRVLNLTVPDMRDKEKTQAAILREARAAVEEDLAECVVLGCTGMAGQAKKAQEELGIPVLDPVLMGLKVAEMRAILWKRFGISHSKIGGYEPPPPEELAPIYRKVYGTPP